MLTPDEVLEGCGLTRDELRRNAYYLHERGLIELMRGYNPTLFDATRITVDGIDLLENRLEFDVRFPPEPSESEQEGAKIVLLVEKLVEEADFVALDGEARKCLLRDVQYLRDEVSRPATRWRRNVVKSILEWIEHAVNGQSDALPSLQPLRAELDSLSPSS